MTTILKAIATALLFTVVGWAYPGLGAESSPTAAGPATAAVPGSATPAQGVAAALVAAHDCWTANGPDGVIPGHVVATRDGAGRPRYLGRAATGQALEQIFDGSDHGLTVHAFCR